MQKCMYGDDNFPILHEDRDLSNVRIFMNRHTMEIFVEDIPSGTTIRLNSFSRPGGLPGGLEFTTDGRVEPVRVSNMIGWAITKR